MERRTPSGPLALPRAALKTTVRAALPPRPAPRHEPEMLQDIPLRVRIGRILGLGARPRPDRLRQPSRHCLSFKQPRSRQPARAARPRALPPAHRGQWRQRPASPRGGASASVGRALVLPPGENQRYVTHGGSLSVAARPSVTAPARGPAAQNRRDEVAAGNNNLYY